MHSVKFLRSTTSGCLDIEIRKSEFVNQFLYAILQLCDLVAFHVLGINLKEPNVSCCI